MRKLAFVLFAAALAGLFLASARGRDDDDEKIEKEKRMKAAAAQVDVLKLLANLGGKEDDVKKQAKDVAAKHELPAVMAQFKPRDKGGVGVGQPGAFPFDSVELELLFISQKGLTANQLATQKADLRKMADVTLAVSYATPSYAPKVDEDGKPIKDWMRLSGDMNRQSKDLVAAIKGGNPMTVQSAARALNNTCESCHSEFRDN